QRFASPSRMQRSQTMRHPAALLVAALAGLLAPAAARAEFIPWKYNWSRSPSVIHADAPGTGTITLTDETLHATSGDTDVVATNLKVFSTAPPSAPDTFTNKPFTLTLFLLDSHSGKSGTVSFQGTLSGTISETNAKIKPPVYGSPTTQELTLGSNLYTISEPTFTPPGPPGSDNSGAIGFSATVTVTSIQQT